MATPGPAAPSSDSQLAAVSTTDQSETSILSRDSVWTNESGLRQSAGLLSLSWADTDWASECGRKGRILTFKLRSSGEEQAASDDSLSYLVSWSLYSTHHFLMIRHYMLVSAAFINPIVISTIILINPHSYLETSLIDCWSVVIVINKIIWLSQSAPAASCPHHHNLIIIDCSPRQSPATQLSTRDGADNNLLIT